jgi:3-hydroxyisobutyrate dehydrogenase
MNRIAFLGLGAMGRRMVLRLVSAGHEVVAWSRSGLPAELAGVGLAKATTPREAAAAADVVIAMVTDDDASCDVWTRPHDGALAGLRTDALAIETSTLRPAWTTALAAKVGARGGRFLEAPVVGSRPQADAGALVFLGGGAASDLDQARSVLLAMGSAVHHVGPVGAAAHAKLLVNALFGVQVALVGELLGFARRAGLAESLLVELLGSLPVTSPAAKAALAAMAAGRFEPQFPIALVAKDFGYAVAAAEALAAPLPITQRAGELFARAAATELGAENITAITKTYR